MSFSIHPSPHTIRLFVVALAIGILLAGCSRENSLPVFTGKIELRGRNNDDLASAIARVTVERGVDLSIHSGKLQRENGHHVVEYSITSDPYFRILIINFLDRNSYSVALYSKGEPGTWRPFIKSLSVQLEKDGFAIQE